MPPTFLDPTLRPDILAPAGGKEQFITALNAGADAIYLGLKDFNARGRAENFTIQELKSLMPLARQKNCKILVAINIVLKENELERILETIAELEWIGIHAIIVQDLGLASLIYQYFPAIRMHASTQMAIHNIEGVHAASRLGFQQVVLARELTLREIANICKNTPSNMKIEIFCHGSLCYSYSGLCFFSGAEDARSGNRGECAYTCRKPYKILSEPGHGFLFSMKDLNTVEELENLVKAGVHTLKIEGRMKDSQYVASTVGLYKKKLDDLFGITPSSPSRDFMFDSQFSFQRDSTSLYIKGRYEENVIDLNNPTHKGVLLGSVTKIAGHKITFQTAQVLEVHDGLRIDPASEIYHAKPQHGETTKTNVTQARKKYHNQNLQFAVQKIEIKNKAVTTAPIHSEVTITIPTESTFSIHIGDKVFKTRSNELKRYTDSLQHSFTRQRELDIVQLQIDIQQLNQTELVFHFQAKHAEELLITKKYQESYTESRENTSAFQTLKNTFTIFGNYQWEAELELKGFESFYIPTSKLKEIKNDWGEFVQKIICQYKERKKNALIQSVEDAPFSPTKNREFIIKIDRLEYLSFLEKHLQEDNHLPVTELIFEPKRAFLPKEKPEEILEQLSIFAQAHKITLRLAIPMVLREWDTPEIRNWLRKFYQLGLTNIEVGNLGGYELAQQENEQKLPLHIAADFTLYTLNHHACETLRELGFQRFSISIEDDLTNISNLLNEEFYLPEPCYILYKDTPLFIAEACSLTALHNGCPTGKVCGYRTLHIEGEDGERYYVAHETCKSVVYAEKPFSVIQELDTFSKLGIQKFRLDFLTRPYTNESFINVLEAANNGTALQNTHTANFHRTLL